MEMPMSVPSAPMTWAPRATMEHKMQLAFEMIAWSRVQHSAWGLASSTSSSTWSSSDAECEVATKTRRARKMPF